MSKSVWILGATSAIAESWARLRAEQGDRLLLIGRNAQRLEEIAEDLRVRGAPAVRTAVVDLIDPASTNTIIRQLLVSMGPPDIVLAAQGVLGIQDELESEFSLTESLMAVNFLSVVAAFDALAPAMVSRGGGILIGLGSVAGDRGKRRNYTYGASKSALATYLEGLRARLRSAGGRVFLAKLGPVETPMTAAMKKGFLWTSPQHIARGLERALRGSRQTIYLPFYWRPIMAVLRSAPEGLFVRLDL